MQTALGQTNYVYDEPWPTFDEQQAASDTVEIAVQVMGKLRARANVSADASEEDLKQAALDAAASYIEGKNVVKIIVVPGRLVNIVAK